MKTLDHFCITFATIQYWQIENNRKTLSCATLILHQGKNYCVLHPFEQADKGDEDANELGKEMKHYQLNNHVDTPAYRNAADKLGILTYDVECMHKSFCKK